VICNGSQNDPLGNRFHSRLMLSHKLQHRMLDRLLVALLLLGHNTAATSYVYASPYGNGNSRGVITLSGQYTIAAVPSWLSTGLGPSGSTIGLNGSER
jgi:hypothetical protein